MIPALFFFHPSLAMFHVFLLQSIRLFRDLNKTYVPFFFFVYYILY